eukprot:TRINITY_DN3213_c0_g1_i1.p1 TRINITY_DN3213_c0_g1~~TRINITY_DN3213_c0_g1_i1.p1  ORF type:complete len:513 (+),score=108.65 TRINITY_DN3213_c0_g1_i1:124-1662(+)
MAKKIIRRRKVLKKKSAAPVLEMDNSGDELDGPDPMDMDVDMEDENDDVVVGERLRMEALRMGGRNQKTLNDSLVVGDSIIFACARGAPTACCCTSDSQWLWYGDKNGNVFRSNLTSRTDWQLMGRHGGKVLSIAMTKVAQETSGINVRGDRNSMNQTATKYDELIATGADDGKIFIWDAATGTQLHTLEGHRGGVTGLSFRLSKNTLFSSSTDRTLKVWHAEDGVLIDTFFGHTGRMTSVTGCFKEEALTTGDDRTLRLFKVEKGTQLVFNDAGSTVECGTFMADNRFLVGCADGSVKLYDNQKRKPIDTVHKGHGIGWSGDGDGLQQNMTPEEIANEIGSNNPAASSHSNSVLAMASVPYSDIAVSGGYGGSLNFWTLCDSTKTSGDFVPTDASTLNKIRLHSTKSVSGIVTWIHCTRDGSHLVVAVSREPRLGRWLTSSSTKNHILVIPLIYDVDQAAEIRAEKAAAAASESPSSSPTKPKVMIVEKPAPKRRLVKRRVVKKKRQLVLK